MKKGFAVLELLIVIIIVVVVATLLVSAFLTFQDSSRLLEAKSTIIGILEDARSRTLSSQFNSNYGVHFETSQAVLFKGPNYDSSDPANEAYVLAPSVTINSINLTGGAVDTLFTRLLGTTTASGTITLRSQRDASRIMTITILSTGNIQ